MSCLLTSEKYFILWLGPDWTGLLKMILAFQDRMNARVVFDRDISEPFNLRCKVKQGCVMAPTLFSIYLCTLLCHAFPSPDGIVLHTKHDGHLFNFAYLRANTKTNTVLIHELMFANDTAFCVHIVPYLQKMYNAFGASCDLFTLKISTKKMVMLATSGSPPCIQINSKSLLMVNQFCYLGSMIARTVTLDTDVSSWIGKGANISRKLRSCAWENKYIKSHTVVKIYLTYALSSLLNRSDTLVSHTVKKFKLNSFHIHCLKSFQTSLGGTKCPTWTFSGAVVC